MNTHTLLADLRFRGVELRAHGTDLKVRAPAPLAEADRKVIKLHKPDLLALLAAPVFIDLETRSEVDLKKAGGRAYAAHASTKILTAVALLDERALAWCPALAEPPVLTWPDEIGRAHV